MFSRHQNKKHADDKIISDTDFHFEVTELSDNEHEYKSAIPKQVRTKLPRFSYYENGTLKRAWQQAMPLLLQQGFIKIYS